MRWLCSFALLSYMLLIQTVWAEQTEHHAALKPLLVGEMARLKVETRSVPDVTFTAADGEPMTLAAYAGKYVLVNFWAPWCPPCREEMPQLSALQAERGDETFEVVTIAVGANSHETMKRFLEEIDASNLPLHTDPSSRLSGAMGMIGLPMTVLINPDSQEIARLVGDADWKSPEALALLEYLMGGCSQ